MLHNAASKEEANGPDSEILQEDRGQSAEGGPPDGFYGPPPVSFLLQGFFFDKLIKFNDLTQKYTQLSFGEGGERQILCFLAISLAPLDCCMYL